MAPAIDRAQLIQNLQGVAEQAREVANAGQEISRHIDKIHFVGCGAPNRTMLTMQYWIQNFCTNLETDRFFPAEYMALDPARLDDRTLVITGSKSGTTKEMLEVGEWLQSKPGVKVGFTKDEDVPFAKLFDKCFFAGDTKDPYGAMAMSMQAFCGGLMASKDDWPHLDRLLASIDAMPEACADAQAQCDERSKEEARLYKDDRVIYHVGSGPMYATAYVFGVCMLQEMLWLHSNPVEAAEFFHGPFECIDETVPLILYLGEDPSRPLMERVVRFCDRYTERTMVYDSKDFDMKGVAPEIRGMMAPYVIQSALDRFADRLSVWRNQPLSTRRYMWKTEY